MQIRGHAWSDFNQQFRFRLVRKGTLNYGTIQTLNIDTANSNRLWEMTVSFEDLTGNPVDADWNP